MFSAGDNDDDDDGGSGGVMLLDASVVRDCAMSERASSCSGSSFPSDDDGDEVMGRLMVKAMRRGTRDRMMCSSIGVRGVLSKRERMQLAATLAV